MRYRTAKTPRNYGHEVEKKGIAMRFSGMLKGMIGAALVVFLVSAHAASIVVNVSGSQLTASANGTPTDQMVLRVAGPDGFSTEKQVDGNSLSWYLPAGAPDGHYRYDVYAMESGASDRSSSNADADDAGSERFSVRESGRFRVSGGTMNLPQSGDQAAGRSVGTIERTFAAVLNFLIPAANAADLDIQDTTPKLNFDDTDNASGTTNWDISANSFSSSPDNFYIRNHATSNQPILIEEGAGDRALEMDANGNIDIGQSQLFVEGSSGSIGIGTATPTAPLHIEGSFPGIQMNSNNGTWRLSAFGDDRFGVRDTDSTDHPFLIEDGAPNFALFVDGTGTGLGTSSPGKQLHIQGNDSSTSTDNNVQVFVENTSGTAANRELFRLSNNGIVLFSLENRNATKTWDFSNRSSGFNMTLRGSGGPELVAENDGTFRVGPGSTTNFTVHPNGDATLNGTLTEGSSRETKTAIEPVDPDSVLAKLESLPLSEWQYEDNDSRHIGPMAEDFHATFGFGPDSEHIAPKDMAGVAMASAQALQDRVEQQESTIETLEARIEELEEQNETLASRVNEMEDFEEELAAIRERLPERVAVSE